jgi:hypothetical protein
MQHQQAGVAVRRMVNPRLNSIFHRFVNHLGWLSLLAQGPPGGKISALPVDNFGRPA